MWQAWGDRGGANSDLMEKSERKRSLGSSRRKWRKKNIKMDFKNWDWGVDWVDVAQEKDKWLAVVKMVTDCWFPQNTGNLLTR